MILKNKRHDKLYKHYLSIFKETPSFSMHFKPKIVTSGFKPVSTLVFKPTEDLPFWKLCTIGASDYLMPKRDIGLARLANRRNEYLMFVAPEAEISEDATKWLQLNSLLWLTSMYAYNAKKNITVSDTIDMGLNEKYCGVILLLPELLKSSSLAKCYFSKHKFVSIFQVMPITEKMLKEKLAKGEEGITWLMEQFYTHDDNYNIVSANPLATV